MLRGYQGTFTTAKALYWGAGQVTNDSVGVGVGLPHQQRLQQPQGEGFKKGLQAQGGELTTQEGWRGRVGTLGWTAGALLAC